MSQCKEPSRSDRAVSDDISVSWASRSVDEIMASCREAMRKMGQFARPEFDVVVMSFRTKQRLDEYLSECPHVRPYGQAPLYIWATQEERFSLLTELQLSRGLKVLDVQGDGDEVDYEAVEERGTGSQGACPA